MNVRKSYKGRVALNLLRLLLSMVTGGFAALSLRLANVTLVQLLGVAVAALGFTSATFLGILAVLDFLKVGKLWQQDREIDRLVATPEGGDNSESQ